MKRVGMKSPTFYPAWNRARISLSPPQDGLEALRIALAAIESLRTGQPVDVATFHEE